MAIVRVYRILLLWVVVSVGIFALVGCGSSKSEKSQAPADVRPQMIDEGIEQSGDQPTTNHVPVRETKKSNGKRVGGKKNPVRVIVYDRDRQDGQKKITNITTSKRVVYTPASSDQVVGILSTRLASEPNAANRREDKEFAKQIGLTQVRYDLRNSSMTVTTLVKRKSGSQYFDLTGIMTRDMSALVGNASVAPFITANVKCIAANGDCSTVRVRLNDHKRNRVAYVVVRQTPATLIIPTATPFQSSNLEHKMFSTMLKNSIGNQCRVNTACAITLNTSETVNGSASMLLGLRMVFGDVQGRKTHEQLLTISGPLASTAKGAIALTTNRSDIFKSAYLVGNNGNGILTIALTFRAKNAGERDETMVFTVQRDHGLVNLTDL